MLDDGRILGYAHSGCHLDDEGEGLYHGVP